jgi:3-phosphoshikimate 1-carboxyvinyltransferase
MAKFIAKPAKSLSGNIKVPGDKSISHRSVMLGSLANGITEVTGLLEGEDVISTIKAFRSMGVDIDRNDDKLIINGVGIDGLQKPDIALNVGNSGTSMRLISGILAAQSFDSELIGDESLSERPMGRIIKPLTEMGAIINSQGNKPPLKFFGGQKLQSISYDLPIASAQVKSCLLLAGMYAEGKTCVSEPATTRNHTENMLQGFGYKVNIDSDNICIEGGGELKSSKIQVPGDISSAAFFMVAASIANNADITLSAVNVNPTRTGVINILRLMGANIELSNQREIGGELLADFRIKSSELSGIEIPEELVPLAIDEFPAIFIAASCAKGLTTLTGAKELRVKESDRIQVMADGLISLGIDCEVLDDGITIYGGEYHKPLEVIKSHHDHRISMSFALASLRSRFDIEIEGVDNVKTSFPNFVELANSIGMDLHEI